MKTTHKIQFTAIHRILHWVMALTMPILFITGICIEKDLLSAYRQNIEVVHKWGIYWFPIFILLHFGGIVIGELTNKKGIVSKMIGGN